MFPFAGYADEQGNKALSYTGNIHLSQLPAFEDWPALDYPSKTAEDIDWDSNEKAWRYRAMLRDGLKNGANFSGKYAVITHGCGSPCQVNWIINVETGKVVKVLATTHGVMYQKNSRLLISDFSSTAENGVPVDDLGKMLLPIKFYVMGNDYLELFFTIDFQWFN